MRSIGDIEDLIRQAGSSGWDFFEKLEPDVRKKIEPVLAKQEADKRTIASAWARFASDPDGAMAIQALLDTTIFRTTWFVDLGTDPAAMTAFGTFREGQNALAHAIVRQIAAGRDNPDDEPTPRENPDASISQQPGTGTVLEPARRRQRRRK